MTLALEPLIWLPGVRGGAGVRLEDTIVVGEDGGRPITRTRIRRAPAALRFRASCAHRRQCANECTR